MPPAAPPDSSAGPRHPAGVPKDMARVFLGGAAGTLLRYLLTPLLAELTLESRTGLPTSTLVINLLGAILLGALLGATAHASTVTGSAAERARRARLLWGTGLLGGFTTYSLFAGETAKLLLEGSLERAAGYALGMVLLGAGGCAFGLFIGSRIARRRRQPHG